MFREFNISDCWDDMIISIRDKHLGQKVHHPVCYNVNGRGDLYQGILIKVLNALMIELFSHFQIFS